MLSEHGAIWKTSDKHAVNWVRKALLECTPEVSIALFKILFPNHACSNETLQDLFSSPRLREHLAKERWWLTRLKLTDLAARPTACEPLQVRDGRIPMTFPSEVFHLRALLGMLFNFSQSRNSTDFPNGFPLRRLRLSRQCGGEAVAGEQ